jgi:hypothetical protein
MDKGWYKVKHILEIYYIPLFCGTFKVTLTCHFWRCHGILLLFPDEGLNNWNVGINHVFCKCIFIMVLLNSLYTVFQYWSVCQKIWHFSLIWYKISFYLFRRWHIITYMYAIFLLILGAYFILIDNRIYQTDQK